jgi:hypothetical protein
MTTVGRVLGGSVLLAVISAVQVNAAPLGSEFTYQGRLEQGGAPMNGSAHLRFSLWDAASGGAQIGASQLLTGVPVVDGIFTVQLNGAGQFGAGAWDGDARWLEVAVCADPACASSTTLSPRQPVTAAPYARHAAGPWVKSGSGLSYSGGSVGIGTSAPQALFHALGGDLLTGAAGQEWIFHTRSHAGGDFLQITDYDNGVPQWQRGLTLNQTGNVGIGIVFPTAKLDVRGTVKHGPSGQYFVPGSEENLRILRGTVDALGAVLEGSGFNVTRTNAGIYLITFHSAFLDVPASTASAVTPSSGTRVCHIGGGSTAGQTYVGIKDGGGNYVDSGFHFWIIGPRF